MPLVVARRAPPAAPAGARNVSFTAVEVLAVRDGEVEQPVDAFSRLIITLRSE